jgi:hypothetical protein
MKIHCYIHHLTGEEYPASEYVNHGYGGIHRGKKGNVPDTGSEINLHPMNSCRRFVPSHGKDYGHEHYQDLQVVPNGRGLYASLGGGAMEW